MINKFTGFQVEQIFKITKVNRNQMQTLLEEKK